MNHRMHMKSLRVGIDARFITRLPRRGIGNYSLNLVNELVRLDQSIQYILYIAEPDIEGLLPRMSNVTIRKLSMPAYPLWEQVSLPLAVRHDQLDILHCLGNTAPLVLPSSVRLVLSLMDVMFLQTVEFVPKPTNLYQALGRIYRRTIVPRCARSADQIITISEFSRRDILHMIPDLDPVRVHVAYLSCDAAFKLSSSALALGAGTSLTVTSRPYIFALGAEDPRKNTLRLIKVYLELLQRHGIDEDLVISGYSNWEDSDAYHAVRGAGATDRVKFLSFVSINELAALYCSASLFVYPSLYEGFGIPMLEAFSSGCPVIASNITSIPEVGGEAALYFDPLNEGEMANVLLRVLNDSELRETLRELGFARAKQFSWTETARKTLAVYRECID